MSHSKKILDKSKYTKKTIDTFEIISAYFIDIYYNHLFIEAKKLKTAGTVNSITEGYKHTLNAFLQGIENPKLYKKSLVGLHNFFINYGFSSMSFAQCIDRITQEFIPGDYYESVTKEKRISILRIVISNSNKSIIEKIVRKYLERIIDYHNEVDNIRVLQDEFIDILLFEREAMYHRFISTRTKVNKNSPHINVAMIEKMQNEIKTAYQEKYELKKLILSLKKIIIAKEEKLNEQYSLMEQLNNLIEELKNELKENSIKEVRYIDTSAQSEIKNSSDDSNPTELENGAESDIENELDHNSEHEREHELDHDRDHNSEQDRDHKSRIESDLIDSDKKDDKSDKEVDVSNFEENEDEIYKNVFSIDENMDIWD
jgi:hypothetical protein